MVISANNYGVLYPKWNVFITSSLQGSGIKAEEQAEKLEYPKIVDDSKGIKIYFLYKRSKTKMKSTHFYNILDCTALYRQLNPNSQWGSTQGAHLRKNKGCCEIPHLV